MAAFRIFLAIFFAGLLFYTAVVGSIPGWNLLPVFLGDIAATTWPGQFNMDFSGFLMLSGIWLAWRHHFSVGGLALGVLGFFGGMLFLSAYLLVVSFKVSGDMEGLLMGQGRVRR